MKSHKCLSCPAYNRICPHPPHRADYDSEDEFLSACEFGIHDCELTVKKVFEAYEKLETEHEHLIEEYHCLENEKNDIVCQNRSLIDQIVEYRRL